VSRSANVAYNLVGPGAGSVRHRGGNAPAAALVGVTLSWSALVLRPELRQSLINMLFRPSIIEAPQA
jgi:hypothetical protein